MEEGSMLFCFIFILYIVRCIMYGDIDSGIYGSNGDGWQLAPPHLIKLWARPTRSMLGLTETVALGFIIIPGSDPPNPRYIDWSENKRLNLKSLFQNCYY